MILFCLHAVIFNFFLLFIGHFVNLYNDCNQCWIYDKSLKLLSPLLSMLTCEKVKTSDVVIL